jgi:hypothetical protein
MGLEVGVGLLLAGAASDAVGKIDAGNDAERAGNINSRMALDNAKRARLQGDSEERQLRADAAQTIGGAKASYGAAGIKSGSGSALSVLESSAATAEADAMNIRQQTDLNVRQYQNEAKLARLEGKSAKTGSRFGAATSVLTGASKRF